MGVISLGCLKSVQEKGLLGQEKLSLGGQSEKREMKRGRKTKPKKKKTPPQQEAVAERSQVQGLPELKNPRSPTQHSMLRR